MCIFITFKQLLILGHIYNERSCTFFFTSISKTSKKNIITHIGDSGAWVHRQTLETFSCFLLHSRYTCNEIFTYLIQRIIIYISFYRFFIARYIELAYNDITSHLPNLPKLQAAGRFGDLIEIENTPMVNIGNQLLPLGTICRHC